MASRVYLTDDENGDPVLRSEKDGELIYEEPVEITGDWQNFLQERKDGEIKTYVNFSPTGVGLWDQPEVYYVNEGGYLIGTDWVTRTKLFNVNEADTNRIADVTLTKGPLSQPFDINDPATYDRKIQPAIPVFTQQPNNAVVADGQSAVFLCSASSGVIRWNEIGVGPLPRYGRRLEIPNVDNRDNGRMFYAEVFSVYGSVESDVVSLTVSAGLVDPYFSLVEILCHFDEIGDTSNNQEVPVFAVGPMYWSGSDIVDDDRCTMETGGDTPTGRYWQYAKIEDYVQVPFYDAWGPWIHTQAGVAQEIGTEDFCFECLVQGGAIPPNTAPYQYNDTMVPLLVTGGYTYPTDNYWYPRWRAGMCYTDTTGRIKWGFHKKTLSTPPSSRDDYPDDRAANYKNAPGLNELVSSTTNIRDGEWHYICVDRRDNITRIFVDGVLEGTAEDPWDYGTEIAYSDTTQPPLLPNRYGIGSCYDFYQSSQDARWGIPGEEVYLLNSYPTWMGAISEMRLTVGASRYVKNYTPNVGRFPESAFEVVQVVSPAIPSALAAPASFVELDDQPYGNLLVNSPLGQPALQINLPLIANSLVPTALGEPTLEITVPEPVDLFVSCPLPIANPIAQVQVPWSVVAWVRSPIGAPALRLNQKGAVRLAARSPLGAPAIKVTFPSSVNALATVRTALGAPRILVFRNAGSFEVDLLVPTPMTPAVVIKNPPGEVEILDAIAILEDWGFNYGQNIVEGFQVEDTPFTFLHRALEVVDSVGAVDVQQFRLVATILEAANIEGPLSIHQVANMAEILSANDIVQGYYHAVVAIWAAINANDSVFAAQAYRLMSNIEITDTDLLELKFTYLAELADEIEVAGNFQNTLTIMVEETAELQAFDSIELNRRLLAELFDTVEVYSLLKTPAQLSQGVAVNLEGSMPISEYDNFVFNSMAYFKGTLYGASDAGLFALDADDDEGVPITAELGSLMLDFGTSRQKRIRSAYLGYTSENELVLKVRSVSDGQLFEHWYKACPVTADAPREGRIHVGQGMRSRYWQFELTNVDGGDFEIDQLELYPLPLTRRV